MIDEREGNLLHDDAAALVNPVNCVGTWGAGLAWWFRRYWPDQADAHRIACMKDEVRPGEVLAYPIENDRWLVCLPTKRHWRDRSLPEDVRAGTKALARWCEDESIASVAIPMLGCGHGGLHWPAVARMIWRAFGDHPTEARVYGPMADAKP